MAAPNFANIPQELKRRAQWVLWKTITRAGKPTKVPYRPTGVEADSTDPASWSPYDTVVESYHRGGYDGIGYVFDPLDPYAGIDLDDCVNPDGSIEPKAKAICDSLDSYSEISPSGKGIKIFLKAKNPVKIQKKDGKFQQGFASKKPDLEIEIYYGNRFFTLTGNRLDDYPPTIEDRNSVLTAIFRGLFKDRGYFGDEVRLSEPTTQTTNVGRGTVSPEGGKRFAELLKADPGFAEAFTVPAPVGKRSDVEFNLCARLWEAGIDEADIHIIMNASPQTKWFERDDNYRHETIRKAIAKSKASHAPAPKELWDATPEEAEALLAAVMGERGKAPMSEEEFNAFKLDSGPKFTCNLPGDNFITRFMQYGSEISDAYRDYWFAGAIFALAVATDKKLKFELGQDTIYTNVYIYIAGGSTLARKTTALKKSVRMIEESMGGRLGISKVPNEFSPEAFIEHMDQFNHAPWIRDEAAGVLSLMRKDYMRGFKDTLMQLYDCTPITRMLRTSQRKAEKTSFNIADPFLNVFFASTDAALGANTEANDALSGFLARFMFFYPQGEKDGYMPLRKGTARHSELEEIAREQLRGIVELMDSIPDCVDMNYTPDAQAYYEEWQERREKELARLKDGFSSQIFGRLMPAVVKLAVLFEVGSPGFNPSKPIGLASFQEACRLADEYFLPMSRAVYDLVGQTEEKNVIDKIVAYLKRNGGRATQRETARAIKIKSKELAEYLSTMLEYGMIDRREKDNGGKGRNQVYLFLREADGTNVPKIHNVTNVTNVPDKECVMDSPGTLVTLVPLETLETLEPIVEDSIKPAKKEDPGFQKFRGKMKKRTCCLCGRTFPYDLTYHANGDKSGYECTTCLMHGPPPEPEKANPQTKLEASG